MNDLIIRNEEPNDRELVRAVNERAFGSNPEADLVDRLRKACDEQLSFVAVIDQQIVGHILFTPAVASTSVAESEPSEIKGMGLAPLAVLPDFQNQGIGTALVRFGIDRVRTKGFPFIIVVGHPNYYPRFGFEQASSYGLRCQYEEVPDEAFMILALDPRTVQQMKGVVKYRPEFDDAI